MKFNRLTLRHIGIGAAALALGAKVIIGGPAAAFTVGHFQLTTCVLGICQPYPIYSTQNHEQITARALFPLKVQLSDSTYVTFNPTTILYLEERNADTDSLYYDVAKFHFDNDSVADGQAWLVSLRRAIVSTAINGYYVDAQNQLGRALHTVQDFYAHSTWVEENPSRKDVAPLGRPALQLPPELTPATGVTCTSGATQTILDPLDPSPFAHKHTGIVTSPEVPFTTESFSLAQLIPSNDVYWSTVLSGKCIHGLSDRNNNDSSGFGAGINKDNSERDFFTQARDLAIQATAQFVNDVLSDLKGHDPAICGLLGSHSSSCGLVISFDGPRQRCNVIVGVSGLCWGTVWIDGVWVAHPPGFQWKTVQLGPDQNFGLTGEVAIDTSTGDINGLTVGTVGVSATETATGRQSNVALVYVPSAVYQTVEPIPGLGIPLRGSLALTIPGGCRATVSEINVIFLDLVRSSTKNLLPTVDYSEGYGPPGQANYVAWMGSFNVLDAGPPGVVFDPACKPADAPTSGNLYSAADLQGLANGAYPSFAITGNSIASTATGNFTFHVFYALPAGGTKDLVASPVVWSLTGTFKSSDPIVGAPDSIVGTIAFSSPDGSGSVSGPITLNCPCHF
jgi:hypothetical protein